MDTYPHNSYKPYQICSQGDKVLKTNETTHIVPIQFKNYLSLVDKPLIIHINKKP